MNEKQTPLLGKANTGETSRQKGLRSRRREKQKEEKNKQKNPGAELRRGKAEKGDLVWLIGQWLQPSGPSVSDGLCFFSLKGPRDDFHLLGKISKQMGPTDICIIHYHPNSTLSAHKYLWRPKGWLPYPKSINVGSNLHFSDHPKEAAACFSLHLPLTPSRTPAPVWRSQTRTKAVFPRVRAVTTEEPATVDYSSSTSVFPAEACETIGGETCMTTMYPEVKLKMEPSNTQARAVTEEVDREYLEYNESKTVFPGEACDDLGGEFCETDYQMGVFQEKALTS
ncbi:hypothetical protein H6P81_012325 [Aristolochia fimbriata]|uniref:Uncharacterized protein n=1 Tax=Aristolochia fimbriata TaxID=158543 RepID=A0AAV7EBH0_ARIFI|nr:hypothetical protein H6P81_012325 [Aristolochia fimbriata]